MTNNYNKQSIAIYFTNGHRHFWNAAAGEYTDYSIGDRFITVYNGSQIVGIYNMDDVSAFTVR